MTESFDWTTSVASIADGGSSGASISTAFGRNSTQGVLVSSNGVGTAYIRKNLGGNYQQTIHHFAFQRPLAGDKAQIFGLLDNGAQQLEVVVGVDGLVQLRRNNVLLVSGTPTIPLATWNAIAVKAIIASSAGFFEVKVNDLTLNFTGDTQATANASASQVQLGNTTQGGNFGTIQLYFDDYVAIDASVAGAGYLTDPRVCCRFPSGAGNYTQWTPSTGSNWQNVDDAVPDDDTTYNESATAGQKDSFTLPSLPVTTGTVYAQNVKTRVRKTDAGARTVRNILRSGGSDQAGTTITPTTTYAQNSSIFEQTSGAVDWTIATSNSLEPGYELVA